MSEQNDNNVINNHIDNHIDNTNLQELKNQINNQEMKKWFNKLLDEYIEQNILQIVDVNTNKEQIIDEILLTVSKSKSISIAAIDKIIYAPNELAIHSPVIKEFLDCERDLTQPFKIKVTSKALDLLISMLCNKQKLKTYHGRQNFMNEELNYETSYLINYLMIGRSDIADKVKIKFKLGSCYEGNNRYIYFTNIILTFDFDGIEYIIDFEPFNAWKNSDKTSIPYKFSEFVFSYCENGDDNLISLCKISEKVICNSADAADVKLDQSFRTFFTHEHNSLNISCGEYDELKINFKLKKYYACLLQDLMKNNCAKLCFYLHIDLLVLCKMILCFNHYKP
jgi:hypothetical protein